MGMQWGNLGQRSQELSIDLGQRSQELSKVPILQHYPMLWVLFLWRQPTVSLKSRQCPAGLWLEIFGKTVLLWGRVRRPAICQETHACGIMGMTEYGWDRVLKVGNPPPRIVLWHCLSGVFLSFSWQKGVLSVRSSTRIVYMIIKYLKVCKCRVPQQRCSGTPLWLF